MMSKKRRPLPAVRGWRSSLFAAGQRPKVEHSPSLSSINFGEHLSVHVRLQSAAARTSTTTTTTSVWPAAGSHKRFSIFYQETFCDRALNGRLPIAIRQILILVRTLRDVRHLPLSLSYNLRPPPTVALCVIDEHLPCNHDATHVRCARPRTPARAKPVHDASRT